MILTVLEGHLELGTFQEIIALSGVVSDENRIIIMNGAIFSS